jgi:hypothetical protein
LEEMQEPLPPRQRATEPTSGVWFDFVFFRPGHCGEAYDRIIEKEEFLGSRAAHTSLYRSLIAFLPDGC